MRIYFRETGQSNPKTIIFLHEINMAGWMWDGQLKFFQDYHCIIPDLPEHGKSKELNFTIENAAEMVIDLILDKAHNGKVHLVGIGLGGQVILEILNKAPERVKTAFISGTLANNSDSTETFLKLLNYLLEKYIPVKNENLTIGSYIRSYGIPRKFIKKFKESTYVIQPDSADRIIRENILFKIPFEENIDVQVLLTVGEKEYNVIKQSTRILDDKLPNSKAYQIPGVGHIWNIESSKLFNQVLRSWIDRGTLPDTVKKI